jgi:hypothetical protein
MWCSRDPTSNLLLRGRTKSRKLAWPPARSPKDQFALDPRCTRAHAAGHAPVIRPQLLRPSSKLLPCVTRRSNAIESRDSVKRRVSTQGKGRCDPAMALAGPALPFRKALKRCRPPRRKSRWPAVPPRTEKRIYALGENLKGFFWQS